MMINRYSVVMPRVFIFFAIVLLSLSGVASVFAETSVVASVAELRKLGVEVERLHHDTPGASVEIGSLVGPGKTAGEYDHTECVVLSAEVDAERMVRVDSGEADAVTIARRSESSKERSIFLVLGKDLPRAYLAFQFNVREGEAMKPVRYLFPISRIAR